MFRSLAQTATLALFALVASSCSPGESSNANGPANTRSSSANTAASTPRAATVSDADGNRLALLSRTTDATGTCTYTTTTAAPHRIARSKDGSLSLTTDTGSVRGSISGAAQGSLLRDAAGTTIGRVVQPPQLPAVSLIDKQGIAVFRIRIDKQGRAVIRDKASMPVMVVHSRGGRFVAETKNGAIRAYVTGEDDLMVAALLTTEFVEPELRGLLACDWALGRTKKYVP